MAKRVLSFTGTFKDSAPIASDRSKEIFLALLARGMIGYSEITAIEKRFTATVTETRSGEPQSIEIQGLVDAVADLGARMNSVLYGNTGRPFENRRYSKIGFSASVLRPDEFPSLAKIVQRIAERIERPEGVLAEPRLNHTEVEIGVAMRSNNLRTVQCVQKTVCRLLEDMRIFEAVSRGDIDLGTPPEM